MCDVVKPVGVSVGAFEGVTGLDLGAGGALPGPGQAREQQ